MSGRKKKILVADDALPMRIMLGDVLSEAGYEVETANDGDDAWKKIESTSCCYDLLILDLLMPKMSGFEVLEKIKTAFDPRPCPVLAITGIFKSEKEVTRLKELGAIGFITKNALVDEILFRVNSVFFQQEKNSRKYPRILLVMPVDYKSNGTWRTNYSSTLSAGGLFIRTVDPLAKESTLKIKFKLPETNLEICTQAKVVWNSEYELDRPKNTLPGMGLVFQNISNEEREKIEAFVKDWMKNEPIWF